MVSREISAPFPPVTVNLPLPTLAEQACFSCGSKAQKEMNVLAISITLKGETWKSNETYDTLIHEKHYLSAIFRWVLVVG